MKNFGKVEAYKHAAAEHDVNLSQFSLAWILNQPVVTSAIVGASKHHHVTDVAQISDWVLSDELKQRVNILLVDSFRKQIS